MKKMLLAFLVLVLSTPLIGCGAPPEEPTIKKSSADLTKLNQCFTPWTFYYCQTPTGDFVTDQTYLSTGLICGWTVPAHFSCQVGATGESVGLESTCMSCVDSNGKGWTSVRWPWSRYNPSILTSGRFPTDAQLIANPHGWDAYGSPDTYWTFTYESLTLTGNYNNGGGVYTISYTQKFLRNGVITTYQSPNFTSSGLWHIDNKILTTYFTDSDGNYNPQQYWYEIEQPGNYELKLTSIPQGVVSAFIRIGA